MTLYLPARGRSVDLRSSYTENRLARARMFSLPTVLREGIEKQHNCAAAQSASHIGSSVLPEHSGVFASVAVDWERRRSGPRRMVLATSAESP